MRKVSFYLIKDSIRLSYYPIPNDRLRWYTGETIDPKYWNKKKQRAIPVKKQFDYLNDLLDNMSSFILEQQLLFKLKDEILNSDKLVELLDQRYKKKPEAKPISFYDYVEMWLERKQGTISDATFATYKVAIERILNTQKNLHWECFNKTWSTLAIKSMKSFKGKGMNGRSVPSGYTHNSIVKSLKVLKTVLIDAQIDGYHDNNKFKVRGWIPPYETAESIYLTTDQLEALYNYEYKKKSLRNAVNLFLIGCYTGQRWQTYSLINKSLMYEHKGVKMISIRQEKTKNQVSIPVAPILEEILHQEYRVISSQNLRDYIKEAARLVGIENADMIGTHTARRSFATNMLIAGVPKNLIMSITGHKTEREFNKYVKYTSVESAIKAAPWVKEVFG
tara:strand:+ start:465 stop:1637 length:1173 start_codon:yes stop_codon:yes gene_type:complete